jgi:hypothetical protein
MKKKVKKFINTGFQPGLTEIAPTELESNIREIEVTKGGKMVLLHRKDGAIELWVVLSEEEAKK